MIFTRKIKDTETGGRVTPLDEPIMFEWNGGRGFTCIGERQKDLITFSEPKINEDAPF
jgi:hypothetical protein